MELDASKTSGWNIGKTVTEMRIRVTFPIAGFIINQKKEKKFMRKSKKIAAAAMAAVMKMCIRDRHC